MSESARKAEQKRLQAMEHNPSPPPAERERLLWLSLAIAAPPLFWVLQLLFLSGFATYACFPAFTTLPEPRTEWAWVRSLEFAGDATAIVVAIIAGWVSFSYFRLARDRIEVHGDAISLWHLDRLCFMSLGGMLSSGGFLAAIIFETIASLLVPLCG